jgi:hypothetical protein
MNFRIIYFDGDCTASVDSFSRIAILAILNSADSQILEGLSIF